MSNLQPTCNQLATDHISRKDTINALRKALFKYEDETEKKFQESPDLDIYDWAKHRIFVQNMNDIDVKTILNLPSAEPEKGKWITQEFGSWAECSELMFQWQTVIFAQTAAQI